MNEMSACPFSLWDVRLLLKFKFKKDLSFQLMLF